MFSGRNSFNVLGIETSCDDTGVAIVNQDGKVLSNCVHSQLKHHVSNGGIIPMIAKEYHIENIDSVARDAFESSGLQSFQNDIHAIAVTTRPGLSHSLQVGLNYAKTLAKKYSKPLIPIHHMQAHALMPLLQHKSIKFPFMALLISGGHCLLSISERHDRFRILGESEDDAPGDLLDKVARRMRLKNLGQPYDSISGGAAIEMLSRTAGADRFKYFAHELAVPMLRKTGCDFSFAGYRGNFEKLAPIIDEMWSLKDRNQMLVTFGDICSSLQRAILVQLFKKLQRAMLFYRMRWRYQNSQAFLDEGSHSGQEVGFDIRRMGHDDDWLDIVISGGVAANTYITEGIKSACKEDLDGSIRIFTPTKDLCSDNGLMIAWNGALKFQRFLDSGSRENNDQNVITDPGLLDNVQATSESPIGADIRHEIKLCDFEISRLKNRELKLKPNKKFDSRD